MNELEIEVKFFVGHPQELRRRILALGATGGGRVFERNEVFDDARRTLKSRGELLRLRQDTACRLTYKQPGDPSQDQFKIQCERETVVADGQVLRAVFQALGLNTVLIYEKWRETFHQDGAHLCLDELPFGHFLEIEGTPADIRRLAQTLELPWKRRILVNYHQIFGLIAESEALPFAHITFDNFRGLTLDLQPYRHRFEAEPGR